jgi:hypothetical protein
LESVNTAVRLENSGLHRWDYKMGFNKVWKSQSCMAANCKKRLPQWQMEVIRFADTNSIAGYMCKSCFKEIKDVKNQ